MTHITTDRLAELYQEIYEGTVTGLIEALLYESLPPTESRVLAYLKKTKLPVTSRQIADQFNLQINRVGNVMGNLRRWGLVIGEARTGPDGLFYEWRVKES